MVYLVYLAFGKVLKELKPSADEVYETLTGHILPQFAFPGVEDVFAEGSECMALYDQMLEAYERLRARLGVVNEDPDVEIIIDNLLRIERIVSYKMYEYGLRFH